MKTPIKSIVLLLLGVTTLFSCSQQRYVLNEIHKDAILTENKAIYNNAVEQKSKTEVTTTKSGTQDEIVLLQNNNVITSKVKSQTTKATQKTALATNVAIKAVKKVSKYASIENHKSNTASITDTKKPIMSDIKILCIILSFLLPPLAVFLKDKRRFTIKFWIDLLLTFLFWIPGIIFALLVVLDVIEFGKKY